MDDASVESTECTYNTYIIIQRPIRLTRIRLFKTVHICSSLFFMLRVPTYIICHTITCACVSTKSGQIYNNILLYNAMVRVFFHHCRNSQTSERNVFFLRPTRETNLSRNKTKGKKNRTYMEIKKIDRTSANCRLRRIISRDDRPCVDCVCGAHVKYIDPILTHYIYTRTV